MKSAENNAHMDDGKCLNPSDTVQRQTEFQSQDEKNQTQKRFTPGLEKEHVK